MKNLLIINYLCMQLQVISDSSVTVLLEYIDLSIWA